MKWKTTFCSLIQSTKAKRIVICNIHVLYNPKRGEIKLGQVRTLIDRAYSVSRQWDNAPVIICGDFNSTPKSPLYEFISMQKLDLSGLSREQISGQYSSSLQLPNAPFVSAYRWYGSPIESNDLKAVQSEHIFEESSFFDQSETEGHQGSHTTRTDLGGNPSNHVGSISDEKLVFNMPQRCDQHNGSSVEIISKQEVIVEEKSCIVGASSERIGSSDENNLKEIETKFSVSSRTLAFELSDLNLGDGDRKECYIVRDIHCNKETLDLVSSKLSENSNQTSLFVMESITRPETYLSCSDADYVLAHEETGKTSGEDKCHAKMQENIADDNLENNDGNEDGATLQCGQSDENSYLHFLSELHGSKSSSEPAEDHDSATSSGNYETSWDQLNAGFQNYVHNPFAWTPSESEIASGNKNCTLLQHNLKLKSAYAALGDPTGTNDSGGEPQVTSYNRRFMGTVDYIWFSDGLQAVKVLGTIPKDVLQKTRGFPTAKWGSDHIAVVCELAFCGDE